MAKKELPRNEERFLPIHYNYLYEKSNQGKTLSQWNHRETRKYLGLLYPRQLYKPSTGFQYNVSNTPIMFSEAEWNKYKQSQGNMTDERVQKAILNSKRDL
jgi:hypothetical protein